MIFVGFILSLIIIYVTHVSQTGEMVGGNDLLDEMWGGLLRATPLIALLVTIMDVWLRDDRDIIQGYSKVDNLVIVSIFQREKTKKLEV